MVAVDVEKQTNVINFLQWVYLLKFNAWNTETKLGWQCCTDRGHSRLVNSLHCNLPHVHSVVLFMHVCSKKNIVYETLKMCGTVTVLGYKMKRRVGAIEEFEFEPLISGGPLQLQTIRQQLHITIAITGWIDKKMPGLFGGCLLNVPATC